jgi:YidC/Oxa1 family membrane protein insertase
MDFQRYLLIGAIALLSFMLMTEWAGYQQRHSLNASTAAYQAQQQGIADNGDLPGAPVATAPSGSDLPPALPSADPVADTGEVATRGAGTQPRYLRVRTDVLELQIDRFGGDIVFAALSQFKADLKTPDVPFVLLEQSPQRTYVAQSGLIGRNGIDTSAGRAQLQADAAEYRMEPGTDELVVDLHYRDQPGITITKRFRFRRGDYLVDVSYLIDNNSAERWQGAMFGQLKHDGSPDPSAANQNMFSIQPYLGAATTTADTLFEKLPFKNFSEKPLKMERQGGWIAVLQHYFVSAWIPAAEATNSYGTVNVNGSYIARFTGPATEVAPGSQGEVAAQVYIGPKDQYRLETISPGLDLSVDYGILWWIAQPLFWLLTKIHGVLGNWGWSIVVLTLFVKIAFFWLNAKAYTSMANMRRVQPKLMELRERYADDRQKQSQEMMNLYKTEKINPLGGCLPILVQMPVFLALYWVLMESVELRQAPWLLWIKDLAAMDPYFVLPLLMGVSMFVQQKLNPPPPDPMQAKLMQWMPVIFTFFFLWFPAGLVLYWVVNNTLSIAQQYVITKRIEAKA